MLFFPARHRVIAHDQAAMAARQVDGGHDMDHYADDLAALTAHLISRMPCIGHPPGRRVVHYLARHGGAGWQGRRLSAAPAADGEDGGQSGRAAGGFDGLQAQLAASRAQLYYDFRRTVLRLQPRPARSRSL